MINNFNITLKIMFFFKQKQIYYCIVVWDLVCVTLQATLLPYTVNATETLPNALTSLYPVQVTHSYIILQCSCPWCFEWA